MTPPPGTLCRANQLLREGLARYAVPYVAVLARLQRNAIDGVLSVRRDVRNAGIFICKSRHPSCRQRRIQARQRDRAYLGRRSHA
jgi:hypothetical protein